MQGFGLGRRCVSAGTYLLEENFRARSMGTRLGPSAAESGR